MAQGVQTTGQEYWRPANPQVARLANPTALIAACWRCGMDYAVGARFCHVCGSDRDPRPTLVQSKLVDSRRWSVAGVRHRLGLSAACFIFFLAGLGCMVGAALTGVLFRADTFVDWQAIQSWRIEWLLAATAALLAGILVKSKED